MVTLTSANGLSVTVNPAQITYVQEASVGCVIFLSSGTNNMLTVKQPYLEVVGMLKAN